MRKSTMVTFTSGDRHRFEPPRTQTAFIDLTNFWPQKCYCNRLGSKTTKLWVFRPILLGWENFSHSVAFFFSITTRCCFFICLLGFITKLNICYLYNAQILIFFLNAFPLLCPIKMKLSFLTSIVFLINFHFLAKNSHVF